jgi:hypothetical protein
MDKIWIIRICCLIVTFAFLAVAVNCRKEIKRKIRAEEKLEKKCGFVSIWAKGGPEALSANSEEIIYPIALIFTALPFVLLALSFFYPTIFK